MLTILGEPGSRFCDGVSRRDFLKIGGLGLGGLSLPQILEAERHAGISHSHKAVIMIYLTGGPPHLDMFDLKPDAPREIRGEFQPIRTNVPGIQICELMPRTAAIMDKLVVIRSMVGAQAGHTSFQCTTGRTGSGQPKGGWPTIGSVLSKLEGPVRPEVPPFVNLFMEMAHKPYNIRNPSGFLGQAHSPLRPGGEIMADMILKGISVDRMNDRRALLASFDHFRRNLDSSRVEGLDAFSEQAFNILRSSKMVEAMDLDREDPRIRARYGEDDPNVLSYSNKGYQALMSKFLMARRLVEAGARCVTVSFADFDFHSDNFGRSRKVLPLLDQGISALVEDLHDRGLDRDVTVIAWGEFGRTPKINQSAGRDHWPLLSCALLAGGGMRTGQVIGSTNRFGEEAAERPVHFQEVFATLYHNLGIDAARTTVTDLSGRPQYLVDGYEPIREVTSDLTKTPIWDRNQSQAEIPQLRVVGSAGF